MTMPPLARIAVAINAATLFVLGLAYWWQGNLFHEVVGTLFVLLLIVHNVTVLRWYAALAKGKWTIRRYYSTAVNALILMLMVTLAVTSVMVSQSLFTALPVNVGYSARDAHVIIAYWALVVMGLHLGLHWSRIMAAVQRAVPMGSSRLGAIAARIIALAVVAFGIQSVLVMMLAEKLLAIPALEMWDFSVDAGGFLLRYASIVGLFAVTGHYLTKGLQTLRTKAIAA